MSAEPSESEICQQADELVVRAKSDRAAFSLLYERYYPAVAKYCVRRLFDRTVAEDVLSEVFLEIAEHLPTFPGRTDTDFRRWMFRIATNAINAHLRQSRRRQELFEAAAQSGHWDRQGDPNPSSTEVGILDWPTVHQALLEFDERDQTIVTLRFFADLSHEEIAEVVRATPGAVRTALSRTLARLREKFNPPVATAPAVGTPPRS